MNPILIFLICFGLSLNLYAAVVCKGALLPSIRKNDLIYYSFVFAVWQLITLSLGNIIAIFLSIAGFIREGQPIDRLLAIVIFVCIAFRMLKAAWKRETMHGIRSHPSSAGLLQPIPFGKGVLIPFM